MFPYGVSQTFYSSVYTSHLPWHLVGDLVFHVDYSSGVGENVVYFMITSKLNIEDIPFISN